MKDTIIYIGIVVLFIICLVIGIYSTVICWNVPIAERTGICALKGIKEVK